MKKLLVGATLVVIALILFAIPQPSRGAELVSLTQPQGWKQTPGRPNQWEKELGESAGEIRLIAERNRGMPLYILIKRCVKDKQFSSLAWYKGALSAQGYSCEGRHLYSTDPSFWEGRGGELPEELKMQATRGKK